MIGGLIIACTLFLALLEKPHLFKRPVKVEKFAILAILLGIAIFSILKEINSNHQQEHASNIIDSLNYNNKFLKTQIDTLRKESKSSQQNYNDSIINFHNYTTELLARYGLKIDTLGNNIKEVHDGSKLPAHIFFAEELERIIKRTSSDTLYTTLLFQNDGQKPAYDIDMVVYMLLSKDGLFYKTKVIFDEVANIDLQPAKYITLIKYTTKNDYNPFEEGFDEYYIALGSYFDRDTKKRIPINMAYIYPNGGSKLKVGDCSYYTGRENWHMILDKAPYLKR